ncbi:TPA: hypothetical protein N0F65_002832, partial [Lagenidium giganteum]
RCHCVRLRSRLRPHLAQSPLWRQEHRRLQQGQWLRPHVCTKAHATATPEDVQRSRVRRAARYDDGPATQRVHHPNGSAQQPARGSRRPRP